MNSISHKTILIAGGTGFIGSELANVLRNKNYQVIILSTRNENLSEGIYHWNPEKSELDIRAIERADVIINLAGEGIVDRRWSSRRKRKIINSRIFSTNLLVESLKNHSNNVKLFVNASAIGIYGDTGDMIMKEDDEVASNFIGQLCIRWENAALQNQNNSIRTVIFRIGLVLSPKGGYMHEINKPMSMRILPIFGSGNQYLSWIHIDDFCRMIVKSINDESLQGVYNAAAPQPLSNNNFVKLIAHVLNKKMLIFRIPQLLLRLIFGEMEVMLTQSNRVSSKKIEATGFIFTYPRANVAIRNLLNK